ncbi:MAG TPA: long-chain fatty acid--CoA ligase [Anaerolineae bacterium]|nr:long-chain fatty acid--CoA ligase [Anaerolineae bacterium]HNU05192.1 long-chain fatty acid--CoA ligase [Anaerolineae bacterium]
MENPNSELRRPWLEHYDAGVPHHLNYPAIPLYRLLDDSAGQQPGRPCTIFFGKRMSYGAIKEASDRLAASLQGLGVQPGDRVALLLPNSPQFVIAYFAILKAGAVVVALNPLYTSHELLFHLNDSGATTAITIPLFLEKVTALVGQTPLQRVIYTRVADALPFPLNLGSRLQERRQMRGVDPSRVIHLASLLQAPLPAGWQPAPVDPHSLAVLIYSGGTTGTAKGVMLSHYALVANAYQLRAWVELDAKGRMLAVLPLFHGFGMSVTMNGPLLAGGEIITLPRFQAENVLKAIQEWKPTFFIGVPAMFGAFSSVPTLKKYDLSSIKGIFVGAAPLTQALKSEFEGLSGARLIEGYGLTEAVTAIMANPYLGQHKVGSIGLPFPDVDVKIVALDGSADLPPGESGEIVLRSPTLMLGYYNQPEATAAAVRDGWLYTGDVGQMDAEGYFTITDRKKELIIVGGFNVFPREVDEVLAMHPKVQEAAAVGMPDERLGERVKACVVLREGEQATAEEIIAFCRERLVAYKTPAEVEFRSSLPKSMIGKVLRRELRGG